MKIYRAKDFRDMSRKAANIISAQVILNPQCVLGLATGSSPIGVYKQLAEWYRKGDIDFSETKSVNLDEYCGLGPENEQSYRFFMNKNLFDNINIDKNNTYVPNGLEPDAQKECRRYDELIRRLGGIDTQLLGLGHNGHIGFNEPGAAFDKDTHCVELAQSTIEANRRFFASEEDVPKRAYTMGIRSIMQARRIVIIVSGEGKAEIVRKSFFGPITPEVPASVLQLHNNITLVGDEAALSLIPEEAF
ncbi:MAG: glucosamine-6-phosphate deaminase [Oscillospiraceae bacterium]|jgi:glucosamine-6-phosphate deaminase|nr:glucosamine-6-phosphate deaminase [Oscillospiraceae bacterium]